VTAIRRSSRAYLLFTILGLLGCSSESLDDSNEMDPTSMPPVEMPPVEMPFDQYFWLYLQQLF
jgi:hypothetical protein